MEAFQRIQPAAFLRGGIEGIGLFIARAGIEVTIDAESGGVL